MILQDVFTDSALRKFDNEVLMRLSESIAGEFFASFINELETETVVVPNQTKVFQNLQDGKLLLIEETPKLRELIFLSNEKKVSIPIMFSYVSFIIVFNDQDRIKAFRPYVSLDPMNEKTGFFEFPFRFDEKEILVKFSKAKNIGLIISRAIDFFWQKTIQSTDITFWDLLTIIAMEDRCSLQTNNSKVKRLLNLYLKESNQNVSHLENALATVSIKKKSKSINNVFDKIIKEVGTKRSIFFNDKHIKEFERAFNSYVKNITRGSVIGSTFMYSFVNKYLD